MITVTSYKQKEEFNSTKVNHHQLNAYTKSPDVEFNIDDFESYAISRLSVLRWIEKQLGLGKSIENDLTAMLQKHHLTNPLNDEISHFIGRLCFCQTAERRKWFLMTEKALFEARYKLCKAAEKIAIHNSLCNGISYDILLKDDIIRSEDLNGKSPIPLFKRNCSIDRENEILPYYRIPFPEVMPLIGRRNVYVLNGFAYVPNNKFFSLITGKFRTHLNCGLVNAQKALNKMKNDPHAMNIITRIIHIINGLHRITSGTQYKINNNRNKSQITHKNVNKLSNIHFPLCMQSSLDNMMNDGHLKHGGRMHLGLFLKGIGLSLSEAVIYWRNSFTKIGGGDKFNKQYSYNIRHNYGKEGKRIDYTPYSCNKIISCQPNNGDYHGCPFKIFDSNNLRKYLTVNKRLSSFDVNSIMEYINNNHYQLGCRQYFSIQNRNIMKKKNIKIDDIDSTWSHPNEYFDKSYQLYNDKDLNSNNDNNNNNNSGNQDNNNNNNNNWNNNNNNYRNNNNENSNTMNID